MGALPRDSGQDDPLNKVLREYIEEFPGMKAAILVSDQGLTISSATALDVDVDVAIVAALVVETVTSAERFGLQVDGGFLKTMSIEFEGLTVVLTPFTPDVMLALVASSDTLGERSGSPLLGHFHR